MEKNEPKYLQFVYHVTSEENWKKIKSKGLLPQKGRLSEKFGESEDAVYTFLSLIEAQNALMNWLGEEYEELEEELGRAIKLALLEVDVSHLKLPIQKDENGNDFFEQVINESISPDKIRFLSWE